MISGPAAPDAISRSSMTSLNVRVPLSNLYSVGGVLEGGVYGIVKSLENVTDCVL